MKEKELKELKLTKNIIIPFPNFQQNTIISPTQMNDNFEEIEYAYNTLIDNHNGAITKINEVLAEITSTDNEALTNEQTRVQAEEVRIQKEIERVQNEEERKVEEKKRIAMYNVHLNDELNREQNHREMVNTFNSKVSEVNTFVDTKKEEIDSFVDTKTEEVNTFVATKGQEVQNAINAIPPKSELIGAKGDKGDKGDNGLTPNITIGNVTTLEPNQQATVTRRGTDINPIFDFGIPKGEKGEDGTNSSSGTDSVGMKLLVEYTHTGNQEIHFSNINWATGEATTTTPHGLTGKTEILIVPNDWTLKDVLNNLTSVPIEWTINNNRITVVPNGSNGLLIRKNDGTTVIPVDTNDVSNVAIDFTKFHFEIPVPFSFENFPKGVLNYRFVSRGYIKAGGQYRYTNHSYYDESGAIKGSSYINLLGTPNIVNANSTHCVFGYQIWDIYADNGYIRVDANSIFQGRRKGYANIVFDSGFEKTTISLFNNFKPCGLARFQTYSKDYAYISNNSLIQIYDLGGR